MTKKRMDRAILYDKNNIETIIRMEFFEGDCRQKVAHPHPTSPLLIYIGNDHPHHASKPADKRVKSTIEY